MTDLAADRDGEALTACHDCDLLHRVEPISRRDVAKCIRCGAVLYRHQPNSIERTLALTLAALPLFAVANLFPFMTFKLEGRETIGTLASGVIELMASGQWAVAVVVLIATILAPLVELCALLYVLLPLAANRRVPGLARVYRSIRAITPWAMLEVYLLGAMVAFVKLVDLATIDIGIGAYAFCALIAVTAWAAAALNPHEVWDRIGVARP